MPEGLSTDGKEGGYVDKVGNQAYIYTGELEPPYLNRMRVNVYIERLIVLSPDRRLHVIVPPERIPRCGLMKLLTALRGTTGHA